jgi:hypothetical protein
MNLRSILARAFGAVLVAAAGAVLLWELYRLAGW